MAPAAAVPPPPEIQFAQRLAANEKRVRDRAVKKLRGYISVRTQSPAGEGGGRHVVGEAGTWCWVSVPGWGGGCCGHPGCKGWAWRSKRMCPESITRKKWGGQGIGDTWVSGTSCDLHVGCGTGGQGEMLLQLLLLRGELEVSPALAQTWLSGPFLLLLNYLSLREGPGFFPAIAGQMWRWLLPAAKSSLSAI